VILVNLTCGRNPWKQASAEDSTYRAYTRSRDFLKTILPVSDELNDTLARIFTANPDERISLGELRARIMACERLTVTEQQQPAVVSGLATPPASPGHTTYGCEEHPVVVVGAAPRQYDYEHDDAAAPLSPASSASDRGSLTSASSTGSTATSGDDDMDQDTDTDADELLSESDDSDDDLLDDMPEAKTPPPVMDLQQGPPPQPLYEPAIVEHDYHAHAHAQQQQHAQFLAQQQFHLAQQQAQQEYMAAAAAAAAYHHHHQHHQHHHQQVIPVPVQQCVPPPPQPQAAAGKFHFPQYVWDMLRYGGGQQAVPVLHHPLPIPFHAPVPVFAHCF